MTFVSWSNHTVNIFSITEGSTEYFRVSKNNNTPAIIVPLTEEQAQELIKNQGLKRLVQLTQ